MKHADTAATVRPSLCVSLSVIHRTLEARRCCFAGAKDLKTCPGLALRLCSALHGRSMSSFLPPSSRAMRRAAHAASVPESGQAHAKHGKTRGHWRLALMQTCALVCPNLSLLEAAVSAGGVGQLRSSTAFFSVSFTRPQDTVALIPSGRLQSSRAAPCSANASDFEDPW